ncbi:hypothetical protein AVEN_183179-1 [Araneus ventricosus]|uniref:Mos1 transposase HTH domain-containing protein n=1 Tax=Araneus ventricosus TaxID=182803 RepID=A0A4Y2V9H4_ARAVE|nr:hypothetical protein AVEN_183179-1 [Araneus ventricosus]
MKYNLSFVSLLNVKSAEIHRQISEVYGENIMNEGMVRKWVRTFDDGLKNVHDEEGSGRSTVNTEDLMQKVDGTFEATDALLFHLYLLSILKFQEMFFME